MHDGSDFSATDPAWQCLVPTFLMVVTYPASRARAFIDGSDLSWGDLGALHVAKRYQAGKSTCFDGSGFSFDGSGFSCHEGRRVSQTLELTGIDGHSEPFRKVTIEPFSLLEFVFTRFDALGDHVGDTQKKILTLLFAGLCITIALSVHKAVNNLLTMCA